jgi:hypothetical protein
MNSTSGTPPLDHPDPSDDWMRGDLLMRFGGAANLPLPGAEL